jgi:hypothetical protein
MLTELSMVEQRHPRTWVVRLSCDFDEVDADGGVLLHGRAELTLVVASERRVDSSAVRTPLGPPQFLMLSSQHCNNAHNRL